MARQVADRLVHVAHAPDAAVGEEAAHRLDGVERHAFGAPDDRGQCIGRQTGHEPVEQLAHGVIGQGLERHGGQVAPVGAPVGPPVEQLGPGQA